MWIGQTLTILNPLPRRRSCTYAPQVLGVVLSNVIDVSIVMPCLNEAVSLEHCITRARTALDLIRERYGLSGEVVIADNGSTDGSQALACKLGARVVPVSRRGYGAALMAGFEAAHGRFLVMGDADGSYDFVESAPMIGELLGGADLCMGSRFKGGIKPGAMPWKNRYIGNPALTGLLNILFGSRIDDAHCGLRALTRDCFNRLRLQGPGMEFASEMVVKAALLRQTIAEVPATLSPDLRDRAPHLRPWRDGWRHLRFLMMLSPAWLYFLPGICGAAIGVAILGAESAWQVWGRGPFFLGDYWAILAGSMLSTSHLALLLGAAAQLYGIARGYRLPSARFRRHQSKLSVEWMLIGGLVLVGLGLAVLTTVAIYWSSIQFQKISTVLPAVVGTTLTALGVQNALGGFLLALIGEDVPDDGALA